MMEADVEGRPRRDGDLLRAIPQEKVKRRARVTDKLRKIGPMGTLIPAHQLAVPTTRVQSQSRCGELVEREQPRSPKTGSPVAQKKRMGWRRVRGDSNCPAQARLPRPWPTVTMDEWESILGGEREALVMAMACRGRKRLGSTVSHWRRQGLRTGAEESVSKQPV